MANTRTQRISPFKHFDFVPGVDKDVFRYTPDGRQFRLEIYPRLSTLYPSFDITLKLRDGVRAPQQLSTTRGGCLKMEILDKIYYVVAFGVAGGILQADRHLEQTDYQLIGALADESGKVLKITVGPGERIDDFGANFCLYSLRKHAFDEQAKPLDSKALKTVIEPINEVELTHHFVATASLPGGATVKIRKPVSEIRAAGYEPNSSFSFWRFGYAWSAGNQVAFIGQDYTGLFREQVFQNGMLIKDSHSTSFEQTISSASNTLLNM